MDLIISKKSIAIIFQDGSRKSPKRQYLWKIAFGSARKKILNGEFDSLQTAIKGAKKMGFGGYFTFSKYHTYAMRMAILKVSVKGMLERKIKTWCDPIMFTDEKNWELTYKLRHENR